MRKHRHEALLMAGRSPNAAPMLPQCCRIMQVSAPILLRQLQEAHDMVVQSMVCLLLASESAA